MMKKFVSYILLVVIISFNCIITNAAETKTWQPIASPNFDVKYYDSVELNGKIHSIGGLESKAFHGVYDPVSDIWSYDEVNPNSRDGMKLAVVGEDIYAIGGYSGSEYISGVDRYNTTTSSWVTISAMPTPRKNMAVCVYNGMIYVIGGQYGSSYLNTVEVYNPATNTWSTKADMPTARSRMGAIVYKDKIYVISGYAGKGLKTVEVYDPSTDSWSKEPDMPTSGDFGYYGVFAYGSSVVDDKIYLVGGVRFNGSNARRIVEYTPENKEWKFWDKAISMNYTRKDYSVIAIGKTLYAVGGNVGGEKFVLESTPIDDPFNLVAVANKTTIDLSWEINGEVDSFIVKRSTTEGGPYETIAEGITGNTYIDGNVKPNITYYYVVYAIKNNETSNSSNEASAIILEENNNRAILVIYLLDENDKEYDLTREEVDDFIEWYYNRGEGNGPVYYSFDKNYNLGPYVSRKDYIAFDKIICFEVNEYVN